MVLYKSRQVLQRWRWQGAARRTPLTPLYERALPSPSTPANAQRLLVVDCEMSGLDPNKHALLSIGWVVIENLRIDYSSRRHLLLHAGESVGESIKIHGLCDRRLAGAASPSKALSLFAQQASQSVLVFHHAVLDLAFLHRCAAYTFGCALFFPYLDTMRIEKRRLDQQGKTASLQLNMCRDRYGLPPAFAHNAMSDAIATAELLLAQCAYLSRLAAKGAQPRRCRAPSLRELGIAC